MLDVSDIILDPDFAQPGGFTVYRKSGEWKNFEFAQTETQLTLYGSVTPADPKDIDQIPEGDKIKGAMVFWSTSKEPIYVTRAGEDAGTSDEIEWNGDRYRIYQVRPWSDYGYYKAIGARMAGN